MDKLLELVQEKAGISADQARSAIEAVVDFMKDKLPEPIASQVVKFVEDDGDDDGGGDDGGGDLLGGITDKLGGLLGGD
ncbi:MAG: DUF2267 domain-containing protein [Acidimicrobiia bacterium]